MRLILINPNPMPAPDPPSLQVIHNSVALAKRAKVHLIARRGLKEPVGPYYHLELPETLDLHLLPGFILRWGKLKITANLLFFFAGLLTIRKLCRRYRVDAILVRNIKFAAFLLGWRRWLGLPPIIFEAHEVFTVSFLEESQRQGTRSEAKARKLAQRESLVCREADGVICITQRLAEMLEQRFRVRGKLLVAPDGVDLAPFQKLQDFPPGSGDHTAQGKILYLGSLHHWKGIDILLQAVKLLPGIKLQVVGGSDKAVSSYENLARQLGIRERVRFEGFVIPANRFQYFRHAAVCVLPLKSASIASYFTSPLKLFEYMAAGIPIVASDLPAIREILQENVNGLLVRPDDPKALAAGIRRLLDDPALSERLARQARQDVEAYTWDKRAEKIIQFIQSN